MGFRPGASDAPARRDGFSQEEHMAEKEKPKSFAEAKRAYDAMARQVTELAAQRSKVKAEIERRVIAEMGDFEKRLAELMVRKGAAAREMYAAEERESPEREAARQREAEAKRAAELKAIADANARRQKEQAETVTRRMTEAAK
jgi:hypothetical protein